MPSRFKLLAGVAFGLAVMDGAGAPTVNAQAPMDAILAPFRWRNIGPANMGGRVVDIEAVEGDFRRVFVASASGGVWRSINGGTTWQPIFDHYGSASIGDIAIFQPNPDILWVGTGEANNRNSVSWGDGIYKSTDGGRTFVNKGLRDTHQIARVVTHPIDPDQVYVCALGHLWGYSGDRGLYRSDDGGEKWTKLADGLPDDGKTGCTDLVMDPGDPTVLYAALYHRLRRPWTFHSGGPNGGIFKSTDGGATWRRLGDGLPQGDLGRIGLAVYREDPRILMAIVEAERTDNLARPGSGIYRSEDGGETWTYVNTYNNRPFYYSQIRINPLDDQRVYVLTTRFMVSEDGGRTLRNGSEDEEVHGDFHAMWLDPADPNRYYLGADKGASLTYDHGRRFVLFDNFAIGQYYRIGVDMRDPYYVYGGLQDNGTYGGPSFSRDARGILNDSNWKLHWGDGQDIQVDPTDWRTVYTEAENGSFRRYDVVTHRFSGARPAPNTIINYREMVPAEIRNGGREFRYNWSAPLVMSPHHPMTLFLGAQFLFKTMDGGETWTIISPDLTTNDPVKTIRGESGGLTPDNSGAEFHGTITSVSQSGIDPDLIWVATDDGNVQVTRDGGRTWRNVRNRVRGVPEGIRGARVEASHFDVATAYVVFDGHRSDVFTPWIFKTTNFGSKWTRITDGIRDGHVVHVVREDRKNPRLLFAGTEFAVYVSLDGGGRWHLLMNNLPTVATQDLVIHPRDDDLIAGTHGRSIWILDDVTPLQQLSDEVRKKDFHLFANRRSTLWENVSRGGQRGHFWYAGENPPTIELTNSLPRAEFRNSAMVTYYLGTPAAIATLEIGDVSGRQQRTVSLAGEPGIHRYQWDLQFDPPPFTAEQRRLIMGTFEELMERFEFLRQRLGRFFTRFQEAGTPLAEREAIQILLNRNLATGLSEAEFGIPTAGPGSYLLRLLVDGREEFGVLEVRDDPLLSTSQ